MPVLAHLGMQKVLIDRHELFGEGLIEAGDDFFVALHSDAL
jgi:hypothetical protein